MFHWKKPKDIWKGEGIYHLTFVLRDRRPILGTLILDEEHPRCVYSDLGLAIRHSFEKTKELVPEMRFLADRIMEDHLHIVVWVTKDIDRSIRQIGHGMQQGFKKLSPELVFERPFIRTLARKNQLHEMCAYVNDNPRRAVIKRLHPDLFRLHRRLAVTRGSETLFFSALGNPFLLDYPQRQVVICSRFITDEQLQRQQRSLMFGAEMGAVTYSAAISPGERTIVRAIREAGHPLVIVLKDGFPPEGDPHERFFKPGGVYFDACAAGRLLLLEPTPEIFAHLPIIERTDQAILAKNLERHFAPSPIPHTSTRWRMMAINEMVKWMGA